MSAVELFDFSHHSYVISRNKVDRDTFSSKSSTATDTMNVIFTVGRQVVVDDQRDLLDIDTTGEQIGGDQDTGRS